MTNTPSDSRIEEILIKFHKDCLPEGVDGTAALVEAKAQIQKLITEARINELEKSIAPAISNNEIVAVINVAYLKDRLAQLTKKQL